LVTILANCWWRYSRRNVPAQVRQGELVMSASIIWPVAAAHRHPFLAAEEAPSRPSLEKDSFYLSSAGFRVQFANDAAGQKALRALPAHRFVTSGVGDGLRYSYAEPQHCVCIFVGTQQAYDNYREILRQSREPRHTVSPDYKTQAGVLLSNQPLRQSTRGDPTNLTDYLSTLRPAY
jgi:hypothetical protein